MTWGKVEMARQHPQHLPVTGRSRMSPVRSRFNRWLGLACAILSLAPGPACLTVTATGSAAEEKSGIDQVRVAAARAKALDFLRTTQREDGSWTADNAPGICGLVTWGLVRGGVKPGDPTVDKALNYLATFVQEDGGIYYIKSD